MIKSLRVSRVIIASFFIRSVLKYDESFCPPLPVRGFTGLNHIGVIDRFLRLEAHFSTRYLKYKATASLFTLDYMKNLFLGLGLNQFISEKYE